MKLKLTTSCPATICHRPQVIAPGICIDVDLHLRSSVEHYLTEVQRDWAREKRAPSPLTLYPPPPDTFSLTALHHRQRLYCMFPPRLVTQSFRIFFRLTAFFFGIIICTREHWHSTRQERTEPLYSATIRHISLDCPSLPPPVTLLEEYFSAHLAAYSFCFFFRFFRYQRSTSRHRTDDDTARRASCSASSLHPRHPRLSTPAMPFAETNHLQPTRPSKSTFPRR